MGRLKRPMLRTLVKTGVACAVHWTGASRLAGARSTPVVVGYHRVVDDFARCSRHSIPAMLLSRRMLEAHLDWLAGRFQLVSLDELGSRLENNAAFTRPVAAVTFDDGYADVYHNAFPLLRARKVPAAVFVVTGLLGTARLQLHDEIYLTVRHLLSRYKRQAQAGRLLADLGIHTRTSQSNGSAPFAATRALLETLPQYSLIRLVETFRPEFDLPDEIAEQFRPLTWSMVEEMHAAGIVIGSHTRSHVLLPRETAKDAAEELIESRKKLQNKLGVSVQHFAYPAGKFNDAAIRAVAAAGYRFAYTACSHQSRRDPLLTIPRTLLWENSCRNAFGGFSPALMAAQVRRTFDFMAGCRDDHGLPGAAQRGD
jgi:peptidoglycan/xylan/chitin deacetylase (PgdA/CDA1 family)